VVSVSDPRDLFPAELEAELAELGRSIAYPAAAADFASRITARVAVRPRPRPWWSGQGHVFGRPVRRATLVAVVLLLVLAAAAAAVGLGLPGLRIIFGFPPGVTPQPTAIRATPTASPAVAPPGSPGAALGLGGSVAVEQVDAAAGFHVLRPTDPAIGVPDAAYVETATGRRASLAWSAGAGLPPTLDPGVGLLVTQFDGRLDTGFFSKAIGSGTTVEPVVVNGFNAYWVTGQPHFFFYTGRTGEFVEDDSRWVGDALLWSDGTYTYRLESALGREASIRIAESMR
jgi:hypothetical protein